MRPKLFTLRNLALVVLALVIFGGLAYWGSRGFPLPGGARPETANKIIFVSDKDGQSEIRLMDGRDGSNPTTLLTGKGENRTPVFSPDGGEIAFTSTRAGVVPQVFLMGAAPGAYVNQKTRTSSTKEKPFFATGGGTIYFLDAGKINKVATGDNDADAVFPTAETIKNNFSKLFSSGGIRRAAFAPEGDRIAAVLGVEGGEALLIYYPDGGRVDLLGVARRVDCAFARDGSLVGLFIKGNPEQSPLPQPRILFDRTQMPPELAEVYKVQAITGATFAFGRSEEDLRNSGDPDMALYPMPQDEGSVSVVVKFDVTGTPIGGSPIPGTLTPDSFDVSPDASRVALAAHEGKHVGLFAVPLQDGVPGGPLSDLPTSTPVWSPDGKTIAFVSGKDIYSVAVDGGTPPVNLTKGQGTNRSPAWSPQMPKESGG